MGAKSATALVNQEGRKRGLSGKALVSWGSNVLLKADQMTRSSGKRKRGGGSGSSGG